MTKRRGAKGGSKFHPKKNRRNNSLPETTNSQVSIKAPFSMFLRLNKNHILWAGILATLIIGTCSYYQTNRINKQKSEEWLKLNEPRLNVSFGDFIPFVEGDERNLHIKWAKDYQPFLLLSTGAKVNPDGVITQHYKILSQLVFWDDDRKAPILGTRTMQSDEDVIQEAARLRLTKWHLVVHHKVRFRVTNDGSLPAMNVTARVLSTWSDHETRMPPITIEGHKDAFIDADPYTELNKTPLPM